MTVKLVNLLDILAKSVAGILATIAFATLCLPVFEKATSTFIAWRFGAVGYVYYEIGEDRKGALDVTGDGNLRLLSADRYLFEDIRWGDKLQSSDAASFRTGPSRSERSMFVLENPNCIIVFSRSTKIDVTDAVTGGWLYVGTTSCGLFN
ncbi:hypothetical protein GLP59_17350 [Sulfitobacter sp. M220]|uniref:hypothetical protein n=1 Tax=Sulfitobacter sp. M220 TaxID=2675333 RepID=UPI001F315C4E|nr:hypothetical protein [Sulfitobacter sp. M220]MCF7779375.1 hypothetical protein [Sulfitobacter sp. M220]